MFQCKDLLTLSSLSKAKLLSGASGLDNGIRWVYKPESMHFAKWVKGREFIIISTPVINSLDFNLEKLIQKAIALNMSGAILLVGECYIDKISKEILTYTDEKEFPLFAISGEIPLIDIFEEIGHAIAYHNSRDEEHEDVLSNIIFGGEINVERLRIKCELLGYDITPPQMIFVIHLDTMRNVESYDRKIIGSEIKEYFKKRNLPVLLSKYSNSYVGLAKSHKDYKIYFKAIHEELLDFLKERYPYIKCTIGVGKTYERLEKLQSSFQEASRCITLAEQMDAKNKFYDYMDLGFFNLLYELEDKNLIKEFVENTIGKVLYYDEKNQTDLLETLKIYIENNCSSLHTAEVMHTHRNTIKYRISRIEEILEKDISNAVNRVTIMNAISCYKICHIKFQ